ncbi:sialic acid-binding Ig-like lectin 13 [Labeo rohita]|uniref:Sialic acid-binding Ig-like lectin 13 n=1 Tax=Labeo rohita TaxID=84645 RepID=A0A498LYQ9_LABRO|nr:sialic acid-binding Ig-like lectin 13 [Labeo rohita]
MWKKLLKEKREEFDEWYGRFKRHENFLLREFVIMPGDQDDWREDVPSEISFEMHEVYSDCQQTMVSFLIILTLILGLYALTVGLGLGFNTYSLLVGVAAGTLFMAILWVTTLLYRYIFRTQTGDKAGLIQNDATMVSFLIILTLILGLYALTVGLGLCFFRLTTKLKAHNEAANTYASLHLSAPPSEYETLNIWRDCHQTMVSFLIILTLILGLYALTVGLGLCFFRLTTKLKAHNEAAGTYASLHLSAPPSEYETLNIRRDVPKISPSSSCTRTDVMVCFCEVDGNPSPELEWHLSGRPVTNSSNTFISEERLSSTGLRSSITLHQSLTHTSTLQCVSKNTHGTASQLFQLPSSVAFTDENRE